MNHKVKVVYPSGEHKGTYEGYVLQDMGRDALVLWAKDNTVNVVEKTLIEYQESDLSTDIRKACMENKEAIETMKDSEKIQRIKFDETTKAIKNLQDVISPLNVEVENLKNEFTEFKNVVLSFMEEQQKNRKAIIAVLDQLKTNQSYLDSPGRKRKADEMEEV